MTFTFFLKSWRKNLDWVVAACFPCTDLPPLSGLQQHHKIWKQNDCIWSIFRIWSIFSHFLFLLPCVPCAPPESSRSGSVFCRPGRCPPGIFLISFLRFKKSARQVSPCTFYMQHRNILSVEGNINDVKNILELSFLLLSPLSTRCRWRLWCCTWWLQFNRHTND